MSLLHGRRLNSRVISFFQLTLYPSIKKVSSYFNWSPKVKLNRGLKRDARMLKSACKILKNSKIDKFRFKVSITKNKYIQMLKQKYISCLVNLTKNQINKGIEEVKDIYPNTIIFKDVLICIKYKH